MKLLLILLAPLLAAAQGAIEGVAYNKATKAPVPRVQVRMTADADPARYYDAFTAADGSYRIDNLPPGPYSPWINPPEGMFGPDPMEFAMKRVRVVVKDGVARFDVELTPPSILRGRIFDPDGKSLGGSIVTAESVAPNRLPVRTEADEQGRFSVGVHSGRYRLQVRPPSERAAVTYYPGVTDPAAAETIAVGEAADLGGYDIRLRPAAERRLRGVVRDPEGRPVPGASLSLRVRESLFGPWSTAKSDGRGAFEFKAVSSGAWIVNADIKIDGVSLRGALPVTMTDRNQDNLEVRVHPPFSLHVAIDGLPPDRRAPVRVQLNPASSAGFATWSEESDGGIRIHDIYPFSYRIGLTAFLPGRYLKAILMGDADITGRPVDLGPASPPLRFVFAPNPGRVAGEVEDGAGVKVVLLWADRDTYVPGLDSFSTTCNDSGRFGLGNLRPGNWYAFAFSGAPSLLTTEVLRERVFNTGLWRQAATARVAEGETASLKLTITPWLE